MEHLYLTWTHRALRPGDVAVCGHVLDDITPPRPNEPRCEKCVAVHNAQEHTNVNE